MIKYKYVDRNCERNVNRNNENRLFDSQNNAKGGYACERGVGNEDFQDEEDTHTFNNADSTTFTQSYRMYYYEGSVLPIEWTNQHGCGGNSRIACEIVIQYACEDTLDPRVDNFWPWVTNKAEPGTEYYGTQHFRSDSHIAAPRDGVPRDSADAATNTITQNEAAAIPDSVENRRFGMQESYDYYNMCERTERNKGLYTADQRVRRNDRRGTRQNPNGNRHGFECPEERDYYPWWAPSPWIDIAVLTDSANADPCMKNSPNCTERCSYYMDNTMNWNSKGYCDANHTSGSVTDKTSSTAYNQRRWYNNRAACEDAGFVWYEVSHADNLNLGNNSFVCAHTQYSRVNQLGNGRDDSIVSQSADPSVFGSLANHDISGVNANRFIWTIPRIPTTTYGTSAKPNTAATDYFSNMESAYKSCVVRIRYNISSADFQQWPDDAVDANVEHRMVTSANNSQSEDDPNTPLHQNPFVALGPGDTENTGEMFSSLRVNTNQYGRTFQDRSYAFEIRPLPSENSMADDFADTPAVNVTAIQNAISNGGLIFNVNVRGKRGNIVQTYPAVEYDFVPNALALGVNDMVHFQWIGSDYNPRRGCNNAEGGPPDANTFSTDANARLNSRADRSNLVFMDYMGNNVPRDYTGDTTNLTYAEKLSLNKQTVLSFAPCYDAATDSQETGDACYETVMRIAYLNQQSDRGSMTLRANNKCLTEDELNDITINSGEDTAKNHPLNCAKMNAKPFPYFDGGIMFMKKNGWFPFFSSRNNNFSNRQHNGVLCVGANCTINPSTGVLQDNSPAFSGKSSLVRSSTSTCVDTANAPSGANNNGAASCIFENNATNSPNNILQDETFTRTEADNDGTGDGTMQGCGILRFSVDSLENNVEEQVVLSFILLAVGIFLTWVAFYIYNRYRAKRDAEPRFRSSTDWQGDKSNGSGIQMFSFNSGKNKDEYDKGKKLPHGAKDII